MATTGDSVHVRLEQARRELTPRQVAVGLALVAALAFTLAFLGEPTVHDSLHDFRHAAGITCH